MACVPFKDESFLMFQFKFKLKLSIYRCRNFKCIIIHSGLVISSREFEEVQPKLAESLIVI